MERSPRSVDALVEAQVQRWLAERKRAAAPPPTPVPVVTVSRQFGAQGAAVARRVVDALGFTFWNRELLAAIAEHAHVDPAVLARFDEHHRSALATTVDGIIPRETPGGRLDYTRELTLVARDLVARGKAVLVGRGLNFMIDPAHALRVRVVCPLEQRVRALAEREQLTPDKARALIAEADRDRAAFVRDLFGKDVEDGEAYDLVVSTGAFSLDTAAEVVVTAFRGRFGDQGKVSVVR